jgi:hypothetical protein
MRLLERDFWAISEPKARCSERATHALADEYRRKKRIAAGSFQNLVRFRKHILPPTSRLGFLFFSHKILRWFGGFLMLFAWISAGILASKSIFFQMVFGLISVVFLCIPLLYFLCNLLKINVLWLRSLTYFLVMNIALMNGFFQFCRGIRTNIWTPTKRY